MTDQFMQKRRQEYADRMARVNKTTPPDFSPEAYERHADAVAPRTESIRAGIHDRISRGTTTSRETGFDIVERKERQRLEALAAAYRENPGLERVLALKNAHDPRYDALDPATKMAGAYYEREKAAHKEVTRGR